MNATCVVALPYPPVPCSTCGAQTTERVAELLDDWTMRIEPCCVACADGALRPNDLGDKPSSSAH